MDQMIFLAYDGSINADWVSSYAIRMAGNTGGRKIRLLHVPDHRTSLQKIQAKFEIIENECRYHGVDFAGDILRLDKNVYNTLVQTIPAGAENYCICGMRTASMGKGFLGGTISEQLLRSRKFNVLAIRVVHPGLLGCPGNILFPLSGHPQAFQAAMPFFVMLAPYIQKLQILRIMRVNPLWFPYLSAAAARKQLSIGADYVKMVVEEIKKTTIDENLHIDRNVVLSDDWAKEIIIQAGKLRTQMILLGASNRGLPARFYYGNKIEQILRKSPCNIGIYRKI